jgi:hypothetical protein
MGSTCTRRAASALVPGGTRGAADRPRRRPGRASCASDIGDLHALRDDEQGGCARSLAELLESPFPERSTSGQWRPRGSVGYIVEVYDDAYEVGVTEPETGETLFPGAVPDAGLDLIPGHGPVS